MTFGASRLHSSAIELYDDDGAAVATIYARATGIEILAAAGHSIEPAGDVNGERATITITRAEEARRR